MEVEAAGATGAGVEVEDAFAVFDEGLVGVSEEDGRKFGGGGVEVERVEIVEQVEVVALEEEDVGFRQAAAGAGAVDVAADGVDGGDLLKGFEDGGAADVAEVEDVLNSGENGRHFRAQKPVGVADDADFHLRPNVEPDEGSADCGSSRGSATLRSVPGFLGSSMARQ